MGFVASLIISLVLMVVGELLRPKPKIPDAQASSLDDFDFPTASETRTWPWLAGRALIEGGNVTWYGDLSNVPVTKKVKTGIWSSKRVVINHKYYIGIEMFLCVGAIDDILELRFGGDPLPSSYYTKTVTADEIIFDVNAPNLFGGDEDGGGFVGRVRVYKGTQTQTPNAYMASALGKSRSAYRGLCYVVFEKCYIGTRENAKPPSFVVTRYPNTLGLTGGAHKIGMDANPMCMIHEVLCDPRWGATIPTTEIDADNFRSVALKLKDEGTGMSYLLSRSAAVKDMIAEVERHIDGVMYSDPSTGLLTQAIARGDYDKATLSMFGPSEISTFSYSRGSWATTKNVLNVTFVDASQDFTKRAFPLREPGNLFVRGGEVAEDTVEFDGFSNIETAMRRGLTAMKTMSYPLLTAKIVLNGKGWKLRPGSVFRLNYPAEKIEDVVMRVTRINSGDIVRNRIEIDCVEDIFGLVSNNYIAPPTSGWTNPAGNPVPVLAQDGFEVPHFLIGNESRYAALVAARANGYDQGFDIWTDLNGGASYVYQERTFGFTPYGVAVAAYAASDTSNDTVGIKLGSTRDFETLTNAGDSEFLAGESTAVIRSSAGEEWIAWKTVTKNLDGTYTLSNIARGIFDTVPLSHPAGAKVWVTSYGVETLSETPRATDGNVSGKLLTWNPRGTLPISSASPITVNLSSRASRPYPPSYISVNGDRAPSAAFYSDVTISWRIRHRLLQYNAQRIVGQSDASFTTTPEGTYEVQVWIAGAHRRTINVTAAPFDHVAYTRAMRAVDYADTTEPVTIKVRGLNNGLYSALAVSNPFVVMAFDASTGDTFDDPSTLAAYTRYEDSPASWEISSSALRHVGGGTGFQSILCRDSTAASFTDGYIEVDATAADDAGMAVRLLDNGNYYLAVISDESSSSLPGKVRMFKRVSGVYTLLNEATVSWSRGTQKTFRFTVAGTSLTLTMDGTSVLTATDASLSAVGRSGVRSNVSGTVFNAVRWGT